MLKFIKGKTIELPFEPAGFYIHDGKTYLTAKEQIGSQEINPLDSQVNELVGDNMWRTSFAPVCDLEGKAYAIYNDMIIQLNGSSVQEIEIEKPASFLERDFPAIVGLDTDGINLYATYTDDYDEVLGTIVLNGMKQVGFISPGEMISQGSDGKRFFQIRKNKIETYVNGKLKKRYPANLEKLTKKDIGIVGIISDGDELYRLTREDMDSPVTMRPLESCVELHSFETYPSWIHHRGHIVTLTEDGFQVFKNGILNSKFSPANLKDFVQIVSDEMNIYALSKNKIYQWLIKEVLAKYNLSYGSSRGMNEFLMHTGDSWDYPKWYINYLLGHGERKLPDSAGKLLASLKDGKWEHEIKEKVGVGTIEACCELQLIDMRPYERTARGFIGAYRITERGKTALEQLSLP